ncbi:hypothetical protein [Nocardia sp. MW-W600-9]
MVFLLRLHRALGRDRLGPHDHPEQHNRRQADRAGAVPFRLLACADPVITVQSAAGLAGQPPALVGRFLAELVRANLVIDRGSGCFVLPVLVRLYARELAADSDGLDELFGAPSLTDRFGP